MQYDPEIAIEMQNRIEQSRTKSEEIAESAGENHPYAVFSKSSINCLEIINDMYNDVINCFDEEGREIKRKELLKTIEEIETIFKKVID